MKVFYVFGFPTRRTDAQWVIWSLLATAPLVSVTTVFLRGHFEWRTFPVELFTGLGAGALLALAWRGLARIAPVLQQELTIRAWDLLGDYGWISVELADGRRFRGWTKYLARSIDSDDADMMLADPAVEIAGAYRKLDSVEALLLKRADIKLVSIFRSSRTTSDPQPSRPEAPRSFRDSGLYWVYPGLSADLNEGAVWIRTSLTKSSIRLGGRRAVLRIRDRLTGAQIHCETLHADYAYIERYLRNLDSRIAWWENMRHQFEDALNVPQEDGTHTETTVRFIVRRLDLLINRRRQLDQLLTGQNDSRPTHSVIFMSQWYRKALFPKVAAVNGHWERNLELAGPRAFLSVWSQLLAGYDHPQVVVSLATMLAVLGLWVGILGLAISAQAALVPQAGRIMSITAGVGTLVVVILAIRPLARRVVG